MKASEQEIDFRTRFGERLAAAMEKRNQTVADVAESARVAKSSVYFYIHAERRPSLFESYLIARALNVSLDWLVGHKPKVAQCVYDVIDRGYVCTRCSYLAGEQVERYKYCPGCGAKIKYKTQCKFRDI